MPLTTFNTFIHLQSVLLGPFVSFCSATPPAVFLYIRPSSFHFLQNPSPQTFALSLLQFARLARLESNPNWHERLSFVSCQSASACLRNDLYCVGWGGKFYSLTQSVCVWREWHICFSIFMHRAQRTCPTTSHLIMYNWLTTMIMTTTMMMMKMITMMMELTATCCVKLRLSLYFQIQT